MSGRSPTTRRERRAPEPGEKADRDGEPSVAEERSTGEGERTAGKEERTAGKGERSAEKGERSAEKGERTTGKGDRDSGTGVGGGAPRELSRDVVFDLLRNSRRRQALRYLEERGGRATLSDLAEHVAAIENDTTAAALDAQQRKRVYVGLYQSHLPRLDDADVIVFEKSRGYLELGPTAPQLATYLDSLDDDTRQRDPTPAGFVAVSGLVSLLGVAAGLVGVTAAAVLFVGLVVGVAGLAAVRAYRRGR